MVRRDLGGMGLASLPSNFCANCSTMTQLCARAVPLSPLRSKAPLTPCGWVRRGLAGNQLTTLPESFCVGCVSLTEL